jgi:hypothetical protein
VREIVRGRRETGTRVLDLKAPSSSPLMASVVRIRRPKYERRFLICCGKSGISTEEKATEEQTTHFLTSLQQSRRSAVIMVTVAKPCVESIDGKRFARLHFHATLAFALVRLEVPAKLLTNERILRLLHLDLNKILKNHLHDLLRHRRQTRSSFLLELERSLAPSRFDQFDRPQQRSDASPGVRGNAQGP